MTAAHHYSINAFFVRNYAREMLATSIDTSVNPFRDDTEPSRDKILMRNIIDSCPVFVNAAKRSRLEKVTENSSLICVFKVT